MMIASLPEGALKTSDFELASGDVPDLGDGQVLCRTLAITIGAGQRAGLQGSASYAGAPEAGRGMGRAGVARGEAAKDPSGALGDLVSGVTGGPGYSRPAAAAPAKCDPGG